MSKRRGFTLIELLVVIAIIAILAAILFPVFASAREKARQTSCLSNEKQMGNALMMYAQDSDGGFPAWDEYLAITGNCGTAATKPLGPCPATIAPESPSSMWDAKLVPYVKSGNPGSTYSPTPDSGGVWHCPDNDLDERWRSYGMGYGMAYDMDNLSQWGFFWANETAIERPSSTVFVGDGGGYLAASGPPSATSPDQGGNAGLLGPPYNFAGYDQKNNLSPGRVAWDRERPYRHNNGANYVFADGHAKWFNADTIYPHPTPPSVSYTTYNGVARCATATYFASTLGQKVRQANLAIAAGTPCTP